MSHITHKFTEKASRLGTSHCIPLPTTGGHPCQLSEKQSLRSPCFSGQNMKGSLRSVSFMLTLLSHPLCSPCRERPGGERKEKVCKLSELCSEWKQKPSWSWSKQSELNLGFLCASCQCFCEPHRKHLRFQPYTRTFTHFVVEVGPLIASLITGFCVWGFPESRCT